MTEEQAARTSWHEYQVRLKGWDEQMRSKWTLARWQCYQVIHWDPMLKNAARPKKPTDICKFPWEQETPEELQRKAEEYKITPEQEAELNKIIKILDEG